VRIGVQLSLRRVTPRGTSVEVPCHEAEAPKGWIARTLEALWNAPLFADVMASALTRALIAFGGGGRILAKCRNHTPEALEKVLFWGSTALLVLWPPSGSRIPGDGCSIGGPFAAFGGALPGPRWRARSC